MGNKMDKLKKQYEASSTMELFLDGNFSVVILTHKGEEGKVRVIGCSKRNPNSDEYSESRGLDIAASRALINLDKHYHPRKYKRLENKLKAKTA